MRPILDAAAARVLAAWKDERADALDPGEAAATLQWLVEAAATALAGESVPGHGPAATALGRRLLELLRAEVLAAGGDGTAAADPEVVVEVLRAMEQVRRAVDADWSQSFASRLSGADGLDLVVEVAHDLRSPITSVLFLAETLQRETITVLPE